MNRRRLGELLIEAGLLDTTQLRSAIDAQRHEYKPLALLLVELGIVDDRRLAAAVSKALSIDRIDLDRQQIDPQLLHLVDRRFCERYLCIPIQINVSLGVATLAVADATEGNAIEQFRQTTGYAAQPLAAGPLAIMRAIDRCYPGPTKTSVPPPLPIQAIDSSLAERIDIDVWLEPSRSGASPWGSGLLSEDDWLGPGEPITLSEALTSRVDAAQSDELVALRAEVQELRERVSRLEANLELRPEPSQAPSAQPVTDLPQPPEPTVEPADNAHAPSSSRAGTQSLTRIGVPLPSPASSDTEPLIAIDFGTTRSSVAVDIDGIGHALELPNGQTDMPSVVGFPEDRALIIGNAARSLFASTPDRAICSPKRLLGYRFDDPSIGPYLAELAMPTVPDEDGLIQLVTPRGKMPVSEICGQIIGLLRLIAESQIKRSVRRAVLTIPVLFSEARQNALRQAAAHAGLEVVEMIAEPVAAALACRQDPGFSGQVGVYDFGGGTFDFSIVSVDGDDVEVVATGGDDWLGGDDFDAALAGAAANAFWRAHKIELRNQIVQWQRLLVAAEQAKQTLSRKDQATLRLTGAALTQRGPLDMIYPTNVIQFTGITSQLISRSLESCAQVLARAKLAPQDLSAVYLSGGVSNLPSVRTAVARYFCQQPRTVVPPERAVLLGAMVRASMLNQN
ncbi:MAG: Hsp70 family protein [Deltaproteobacteria bacterium]|nr:Hsp70 family protein [Deltaproteobacteria bacterium]